MPLQLEAIGGGQIDYIDIIRNGSVLHRLTPDLTPSPFANASDTLETIVVLELGWGARGTSHVWEGSLELEGGEMLSVEPRLRGAEIVSPLEGEGDEQEDDTVTLSANRIDFSIRSFANPNNATPAMQAVAARICLQPNARFRLTLDGHMFDVGVERLLTGALSGNLGAIDSPAYRLGQLPRPHQWQWHGSIPLEPLAKGDWIYPRMRQASGQWTWASPVFASDRRKRGR